MADEVVRGGGHTPNDPRSGQPMPSVTTEERGSLDGMARYLREKNKAAANQPPAGAAKPVAPVQSNGRSGAAPQTASQRVAEFSQQVEKSNGAQPAAATPPEEAAADGGTADAQAQEPPEERAAEQETAAAVADKEALERFRAWEQSDMFPEELSGKLHELKVDGRMKYVTTDELRRSYQTGTASRKMVLEAQQLQERAASDRKHYEAHFETIRDPDQFLEIYERNGFGFDWMEQVAFKIAEQVDDRIAQVRAAGIVAMNKHGVNDWNHHEVQKAMKRAEEMWNSNRSSAADQRRLQYDRQQFDAMQNQKQSQVRTQELVSTYENQMNQLRPAAFRAHGIRDTPSNREELKRHLGNVIKTEGFSGDITRDLMMRAAEDLKAEMDSFAERANGAPQGLTPEQWKRRQAEQSAALPPKRLGLSNGSPTGNGSPDGRKSLRDMEKQFRANRLGR